ncbi:chorismate-binding protein [Hydrogenophilus thermoluteolus]|uniref:chorismate-binding protein n=1 Tax=Hydrogenophilus thermoluteolus TaxID=297 RepID=UPI003F66B2ED
MVVYADPGVPGAYRRAVKRLDELQRKLRQPISWPESLERTGAAAAQAGSAPTEDEALAFGFPEEAFKAAVAKAQRYIVDGDIMQVVLSQRMSQPFAGAPLALYRAIRSLNPSPYLFYFDFESFQVVGASPEILTRVEDDGEAKK